MTDRPSGAIDNTGDTASSLNIDITTWNKYYGEADNFKPMFAYVITRIPLVPGELSLSNDADLARLRIAMSLTGYTGEGAMAMFMEYGSSIIPKVIGVQIYQVDSQIWGDFPLHFDNTAKYPNNSDATYYTVMEISLNHANQTIDQEQVNILGFWAEFGHDDVETEPTDFCDRMYHYLGDSGTQDESAVAEEFISAHHAMSLLVSNPNLCTYLTGGAHGAQVFAVPLFGYPENVE